MSDINPDATVARLRAALAAKDAEIERLRKHALRLGHGIPPDHECVLAILDTSYVEVVYRDGGQWRLNEDAPPVNVLWWWHLPACVDESFDPSTRAAVEGQRADA